MVLFEGSNRSDAEYNWMGCEVSFGWWGISACFLKWSFLWVRRQWPDRDYWYMPHLRYGEYLEAKGHL